MQVLRQAKVRMIEEKLRKAEGAAEERERQRFREREMQRRAS